MSTDENMSATTTTTATQSSDLDITSITPSKAQLSKQKRQSNTIRKSQKPCIDVLTVVNVIDKSSLIKNRICSKLNKDLTEFSKITADQMAACSTLKKSELSQKLLDLVSACDVIPRSSVELSSGPSDFDVKSFENDLRLSMEKHLNELNISNNFAFETIQEQIKLLEKLTNELQKTTQPTICSDSTNVLGVGTSVDNCKSVAANEISNLTMDSYIDLVDDFVSNDESNNLLTYLNTLDESFESTGERETIYFGDHSYTYTGKEHPANEPPECIKTIIDSINTKYPDKGVNSCLITRYRTGEQFCPRHSDDEEMIAPESNIYTLSLGAQRKMTFHSKNNEDDNENGVELPSKSLMIFSRQSQEVWEHSIPLMPELETMRYSLTFRLIAPFFANSTLILGDSNTKSLAFGTSSGQFGQWMPGRRVECPKIADIPDPVSFGPHKNIVIHVGINDIKHQQPAKAGEFVKKLEDKCSSIINAYPKSNLYLCPLLPTKDPNKREKVRNMNLSISALANKYDNVLLMENYFGVFCGSDELLTDRVGRYWRGQPNTRDDLHLGNTGVRLLARCIKHCVLKRKGSVVQAILDGSSGSDSGTGSGLGRERRSGRVDGRLYSEVHGSAASHRS